MISMTLKCAAAVALAILAAPAAALAEDFNIEVPIDLTRLPTEVTSFDVACLVATLDPDTRTADPSYRVIGDGGVVGVAIRGGTHRDSVFIRFNAGSGRDPISARYYQCTINLHSATRTFSSGDIASGRAFPLGGPATVRTVGAIPR